MQDSSSKADSQNSSAEAGAITLEAAAFPLTVPLITGKPLPIKLNPGETLFLLGSNGCGKSSLVTHLFQSTPNSYRIAANRELAFRENAAYAERGNLFNEEHEKQNAHILRYKRSGNMIGHINADKKLQDIITRLINAELHRNQQIVQSENSNAAKQKFPSIFAAINAILATAYIMLELDLNDKQELIVRKHSSADDTIYSIIETSDGERAAILIAADILTAAENTLFLIDEPERHLHRAISASLLQALFTQRPDCAFIIATHDIALARAIENSQILLLHNCLYENQQATAWGAKLLTSPGKIPEALQSAILGARRKILLAEGEESSLDKKLYQLLFPDYAIIDQGSCAAVIASVKGAKNLAEQHRLSIFGLVDNDGRSPEQQQELLQDNIYVLPVYAIESLYYCPELLAAMAAEKSENEAEKSDLLKKAQAALRQETSKHIAATARDRLEKELKQRLKLPTAQELKADAASRTVAAITKTLSNIPQRLNALEAELRAFCDQSNMEAIIANFRLKGAEAAIAGCFGFSKQAYAKELRRLLKKDKDLLTKIRDKYFKPLIEKMQKQEQQAQ